MTYYQESQFKISLNAWDSIDKTVLKLKKKNNATSNSIMTTEYVIKTYNYSKELKTFPVSTESLILLRLLVFTKFTK